MTAYPGGGFQGMDTSPEFIERLMSAGAEYEERGDVVQARHAYVKAARRGSAEALLSLGILMDKSGDKAEARRWLTQAAETADPESMTSLGVFEFKEGNLSEAVLWLSKAAQAGDTDAMVQLGNAHHHLGQHELARTWYSRAAAAGDPDAKRILSALGGDSTSTGSTRGRRSVMSKRIWWLVLAIVSGIGYYKAGEAMVALACAVAGGLFFILFLTSWSYGGSGDG